MTPRTMLSARLLTAVLAFATVQGATAQPQPQPTPCFRWSGQVAIANKPGQAPGSGVNASTLWYYGGEAMTRQGQTSDLWTNALIALPLDQDWPTGTPPLQLVQSDSGNFSFPPAVALGALWASSDGNRLCSWGGQFQDTPSVPPPPARTFVYDIQKGEWDVVQTGGDKVGGAAEGQPAIVPLLGQGGDNVAYYSYGHQDDHTTGGWSNQIERLYMSSMVQFDLGSHAWTNITSYSAKAHTSNSSTPETSPLSRADGTLSYVPNLGTDDKGILVSIGGATSNQYVEDGSVLDVYDIGAGGWTRQSTLGDRIGSRINHCAVRASAKVHGVETQHIITYGGQRINQTDRDSAVHILTIQGNEYTWTSLGESLPGQPTGRAGHQCALDGNQLVVIGGLTTGDVLCEQPGVFVLNVSSMTWQTSYHANTIFSTPDIVAKIAGGIGTGFSSSGSGSTTGGTGADDPDTSSFGQNGSGSGSPGASGHSGGSGGADKGAIAGGVVGGVLGALVLAALLYLVAPRRRREKEAAAEGEKRKVGAAGGLLGNRTHSGSSGDGDHFSHEKHSHRDSVASGYPQYALHDRRDSGSLPPHLLEPASDDVEEETRGLEPFFGTGLAPRRELRVVNADDD
ncbi:hypothetical protein BMF94_0607 [Rhodotorula taiwanensis]|uniref:Uncharacterized protein n=1 Tax=Rhodotorula taiwanensis TaxID=741276 RepID=A0A2S5BI00_9BASI|nr:hypothetical protein BMF94_0607 [Rhodotorula taiwanensis]